MRARMDQDQHRPNDTCNHMDVKPPFRRAQFQPVWFSQRIDKDKRDNHQTDPADNMSALCMTEPPIGGETEQEFDEERADDPEQREAEHKADLLIEPIHR